MNTARSFEIIDEKTGILIEKKSYHSATEHYLKNLKLQHEKGEISLYCSCLNHIRMNISDKEPFFLYPATRERRHSNDCCRHPEFEGGSIYEKAWRFDEDTGEYFVRIENFIPLTKGKVEDRRDNLKNTEEIHKVYKRFPNSTRKGEVTIFGLATKINMMAWENIVIGKEHRLPKDKYEVANHVFGVSKRIRFSNKRNSLNKMYYKRKSIREVKVNKDIFFVYMYLFRETTGKIVTLYDGTKKTCVSCEDSFKNIHDFYIDVPTFKEKIKKEPHSSTYVVAGFAYKEDKYHKNLSLGNYCLIPVTDKGLFVESSNEKVIYEALCRQEKRFVKPYHPIEFYDNFIPDFIMYEEDMKPLVGEIFGIENNDDYERSKKKKIALSQTEQFCSKYRFWKKDFSH
ncbi:hypothetical protein QFZ31_005872 [Neobacillus niacini]|uniref:hypothetical protein n=1 Tax=Neobacillus driksii TaxID=3035913 RepID=UPI002783598A|nr:hypothetical protein [Neobacillus niacini]MDQ0975994.1 hypothetical protein [Neobacillus niacini]